MLGKVQILQGNAAKVKVGGREKFEVVQQEALLHTSDGQVRKIKLNLEDEQGPYPVGDYTISDASLTVDEYGRIGLARSLTLVAVQAAVRAVAK